MIYDKHKYMRFDIPIIVEFKPLRNGAEYSWGLTKKFSYEGFSFESLNFNFEPEETLELKLKFPQRDTFISVIGDVIWKSQVENKCLAEVKLRDMDTEAKRDFFKKISIYGNLPIDWFLYEKDSISMIGKKSEEKLIGKSRTATAKKNVKNSLKKAENICIKKKYFKARPTCKVTFRLPKEAVSGAHKVTIVGDFNDWDKESKLMKRLNSGDFIITLELKSGEEYRYKYLIDGRRWENDWNADKYIPGPYGYDDSVVVV